MKVLEGPTPLRPKFMIYSLPGVGKTTLASKIDKSLIIDIEGGANYISTARTPQVADLNIFVGYLRELETASKSDKYDYLVIDTVDWLSRLITERVAGTKDTEDGLKETLNKSNGGYGNGKQVLENYVRTLILPMLIRLNKKGYGICLLAHADKKDMMDSDGSNIEQIAPKIDPVTLNAFIEWCDAIYFLKKDITGERVLQLESDSVAMAKNRFGLTGEINMEENDINDVLKGKVK